MSLIRNYSSITCNHNYSFDWWFQGKVRGGQQWNWQIKKKKGMKVPLNSSNLNIAASSVCCSWLMNLWGFIMRGDPGCEYYHSSGWFWFWDQSSILSCLAGTSQGVIFTSNEINLYQQRNCVILCLRILLRLLWKHSGEWDDKVMMIIHSL